jgi:catechol 2,3-dioxygenase
VTRYPGALFLAAGGYHHHLGLNTWAGPGAAPAPADAARLLSWELIVPYTADAMPALLRLGDAVTELEPDRLWAAEDPWRNQIRIHATNS